MSEDQESTVIVPEMGTPEPVVDDFDKERALATIKKLREFEKQAKGQAKELDELRVKVKADDDAKLTETERLRKRTEELEAAVKAREAALAEREAAITEQRRANLVMRHAATLGAHDAGDYNILAAVADINPTDTNAERDIKQVLADLKKAKPYLFRTASQVTAFGPSGTDAGPESDAQRVARILKASRGAGYGPLG